MKHLLWILSVSLLATGTAAAQADECSAADDVSGPSPIVVPFDTSNCTDTMTLATSSVEQQCLSLTEDVWVRYTANISGVLTAETCNAASFDTEIGVWEGGPCGFGAALGCNDDFGGCAGLTSLINVPITAGNDYYIQLGYWSSAGGTWGTGTLTLTETPSASNDDCAGAAPLALGPNAISTLAATSSGVSADVNGDGLSSWVDNVTPDSDCQDYGNGFDNLNNDVWYSFTPATTGLYLLNTCNSASYDTKLATFTGTCGALVPTACNDDGTGCTGFSSNLFANLTMGTTYSVAIGGFAAASVGTATLDVNIFVPPTPPANDDCAGATPLAVGPNAVSTLLASASGTLATVGTPWIDNVTPDTDCQDFGNGFNNLNLDVWHTFTPTSSGTWLFSTCNMASYDTKVAAYMGACGMQTAVACNDDGTGCAGFSSELRANLTAGTTYLVQLGAFGGGVTGTATLDVSLDGAPTGLGVNYCATSPNAAGAGSIMGASGTASIAANNLVLEAGPMSPGQPGIFYHGAGMPANPTGLPFGEGVRCVTAGGGLVVRLAPSNADGAGLLSFPIDFTGNPNVGGSLMGGSRNFQAWFRDPLCVGTTSGLAGDCNDDGIATGFNLSDGYTIIITP